MDVELVTRYYLLYGIMPLWIVVGVLDWYCHRRASIETTAGTKESLIHLGMLAEAGIPILLGLLLEINSLLILLIFVAFACHEVTAFWDIRYADGRRKVTPFEQKVHDYLGVSCPSWRSLS